MTAMTADQYRAFFMARPRNANLATVRADLYGARHGVSSALLICVTPTASVTD